MRAKAGARVKRRGIYNVVHYAHRAPHKAVLQEGESFPTCRHCGTAAVFEYVESLTEGDETEHVGYDPDFIDAVQDKFAKAG